MCVLRRHSSQQHLGRARAETVGCFVLLFILSTALSDLELVDELSHGKVDLTYGRCVFGLKSLCHLSMLQSVSHMGYLLCRILALWTSLEVPKSNSMI